MQSSFCRPYWIEYELWRVDEKGGVSNLAKLPDRIRLPVPLESASRTFVVQALAVRSLALQVTLMPLLVLGMLAPILIVSPAVLFGAAAVILVAPTGIPVTPGLLVLVAAALFVGSAIAVVVLLGQKLVLQLPPDIVEVLRHCRRPARQNTQAYNRRRCIFKHVFHP